MRRTSDTATPALPGLDAMDITPDAQWRNADPARAANDRRSAGLTAAAWQPTRVDRAKLNARGNPVGRSNAWIAMRAVSTSLRLCAARGLAAAHPGRRGGDSAPADRARRRP
jgi:hypothetical protein